MTTTSYSLMPQQWRRTANSPTNVAETGNQESDEPGAGPFSGEHRRHARPGRGPAQATPRTTPHDPHRCCGDDRYIAEHVVAAGHRTAATDPGAAPHSVAHISGAAGRARGRTGRRRSAPATQARTHQGQDR